MQTGTGFNFESGLAIGFPIFSGACRLFAGLALIHSKVAQC
jgi:hypothetical protein